MDILRVSDMNPTYFPSLLPPYHLPPSHLKVSHIP